MEHNGTALLPLLIIVVLVGAAGYFIYHNILLKNQPPAASSGYIDASDRLCKSDGDCTMAMVECSCDCGIPINKTNWEKYINRQKLKCMAYTGRMCGMKCDRELKCVNSLCTVVSQ